MGIQGLLRNLHPLLVPPPTHHSNNTGNTSQNDGSNNRQQQQPQPAQRNNPAIRHNIRQFAHKSLAIDASSWLHKAGYTCAERLVESTESRTRDPVAERSYCKYMLDRCNELLLHAEIDKIYLVFDGIRVPLKSGTNAERESKRQANLREARRLVGMGRRNEASEKYRSCVKGNEQMAQVVAGAVHEKWGKDESGLDGNVRVKCVWSPYEADSQLAKLCVDGLAHAVVTEDSDVLVYSAVTRKPFPIIYKLDRKDGSCDVVTMDWLVNPRFLAALNGRGSGSGSGSSGSISSRRRRRRQRDRDLDYIYNESPLAEEEERKHDESSETSNGEVVKDSERHACEVEYDDMGHAPIRRALPLPSSSSSGGGKSNRKRRGSSGGSDNASGSAFLSHLRSFANKEAANPGAGVRLFVQACVLSGCDYVPNRLSKVGPVTAFKLVKEASHRDPAVRFERVLKSLPTGSELIAEARDKRSEDEDLDEEGEEEDDFRSPPDNARDAKDKYEELLSKSQAVFYYHLAKDLATGNIVPLVAHRTTQSDKEGESNSQEIDESFRPSIDRFEPGLTFVGSASEALKNKVEPLPPITGQQGNHRRPAFQQQNVNRGGGWMSTNRRSGSVATGHDTHKNNNFFQPRKPTAVIASLAKASPKETALQKFLKGHQQKPTSTRVLGNKNLLNVGITKSIGSNSNKKVIKSKEAAGQRETNPVHKAPSASFFSVAPTTNAPVKRKGPNPFAAFAHSTSSTATTLEPSGHTMKKSPLPTTNRQAEKAVIKSPFFSSPAKFDYGGYTPPPQGTSRGNRSNPESLVDTMTSDNIAINNALNADDDDSVELLNDDNNSENEEQIMTKPMNAQEARNSSAMNGDTLFDYGNDGIVEESPPRSTYSDSNGQLGPRRVSTSPPKYMEHKEASQRSSPESAIELIDLIDDTSDAEVAVDENLSNRDQTIKFVPKMRSVNKRPFKSPYPQTNLKVTMTSSSTSRSNKTSSSAILAGFARQERMQSSSSTAASSGTKRKSRFFSTDSSGSQGQKKSKSAAAVGKLPKGSLKNFMIRNR